MQNHIFKIPLAKLPLLLAAVIVLLSACSDNVATTTTTTITATTPAGLALGTSTNIILTDNSTAATLTATLVDSSNAVMSGEIISFSTSSGNLNASSATTDANGQAQVSLRSGLADFSNRTATVTASVAGVASASVPILIRGSTVALTLTTTTVQVGGGTLSATATVTNSASLGLANQAVRFSVGATSTGAATLSAATLTTDVTGVTSALTITPTLAGTVVLTAEWLDSAGAVTSTATKDIIVTAAAGTAFAITTPASSPTALTSGATQNLLASVPTTIAGVTVTDVRISASSGTLTGANPVVGPLTSIRQTPFGNAVSATYTAPVNSGSVTVQVDALGTVSGVPLTMLSSLTRTFVISAPSTAAAFIFMSPSVSTIVPSSGSNISTSTLEATVRDANLNAVSGAAVMFGLLGTTGSGESVSPAVAITDSLGKVSTTFSAGSAPTLAAIYAQASIVGETCTFVPDPFTAETNPLCDQAPLIVSSAAVSVTIGFGTLIVDAANGTQYQLPGSVLVVDANGSAVAGATVTLSAFPIAYRNGSIMRGNFQEGDNLVAGCIGPFNSIVDLESDGTFTVFTDAEDVNRNGILDAGEDTQGNGVLDSYDEDTNGNGILDTGEDTNGNNVLDFFTEDTNGNGTIEAGEDIYSSGTQIPAKAIPNNGLLSPPQAAGGSVPLTVTTDSNGAATFFLQYPKASTWFIKDEISARVIVSGTESTARMELELPISAADRHDANCPLGREATY